MFDLLFGWRKASKCKKLIKQVQCRLKLLKNKRCTIARQLREDVAELIKNGHEDKAFNRVEQIIKDECIVAVYELLDQFCEFILVHLSYIRRHKDFPNDINEAVSSLVYASARCGDLPELRVIRKLFEERYGQKFVMAALELFPGNLVNCQVKEKLSLKLVTDDMKHRLVSEIAMNCCLKPEVLAIEYYAEWQHKVKEISGHQVLDTNAETYYERSEMQILNVEEIEREVIDGDPNISSTSAGSSVARLAGPTISEISMHDKPQNEENYAEVGSPNVTSPGTEEGESLGTTRDGEIVVYLDDIEEVQSSKTRDGDSQDQRIFKFKSILPKKENLENSFDHSYVDDCETSSENSGTKSSRRSCKGSGKRPRKRTMFLEDQCMKDIDCLSYYGEPCQSTQTQEHRPLHHRKHQKKTLVGVERSYFAEKSLRQPFHMEMGANILSCKCRYDPKRLSCGCSLEHPCSFCTGNDKDDCDGFTTPGHEQKGLCDGFFQHHCFWNNQELNKGMEWEVVPKEPRRRSCGNGAMVYNVFTYPDHQQNKVFKEIVEESSFQCRRASFGSSYPKVTSPWTRKEMVPPCIRTVTMPPERAKDNHKDDFQRSNSFPSPYPTHVHPKLPDYDDIAAKFMALKRERLQNKPHCSNQQL